MGSDATGEISPEGHTWGTISADRQPLPAYQGGAPNVQMSPSALGAAGGSLPHNNLQPYLAVNFVIATMGIFPVRE